MARSWLQRRRVVATELDRLEAQVLELAREHSRLNSVEQQLAARLESLATRENAIRARYTAAEVQTRVNQTLAEATTDLAALELPLAEIEERAEWMRVRAQALDELSRGTVEVGATSALTEDAGVDMDLELLRTELEAQRRRP